MRLRAGVTTYADGIKMASFVQSVVLYVRQIGEGRILVSTLTSGAVTGWVRTEDLVYADSGSGVEVKPKPNSPAVDGKFKVGDKVRLRAGVTTYADGIKMASFVQSVLLYVRQVGENRILVSTVTSGAVTGWVRTEDLIYADDAVSNASDKFEVGDKVHLRPGVTTFADGVSMASYIRTAQLYIRYVGVGKLLISTQLDGAVTGWVKNENVIKD